MNVDILNRRVTQLENCYGCCSTEGRVCLNDAVPTFTPLNANNPTTAEVDAWCVANLTASQLNNGTQVVYYADGTCDEPDFIWTLNEGEITLSDKRVFNTQTVYVDAGSGSDITGKRGYRNFPFKTLNAALGEIVNGDTLYIFPGSYTNTVSSPNWFNIYCEDGVTWLAAAAFTSYSGVEVDYKWRFDYLYGDNSATNRSIIGNSATIRDFIFIANKTEYIVIPALRRANVDIKHVKDCFILQGNRVDSRNPSEIKIGFYEITIPQSNRIIGSDFRFPNGQATVTINNIDQVVNTGESGGIINLGWASDVGTKKNRTVKINNCRYYPTSMYTETPLPIWKDPRVEWFAGTNATGNQAIWVRNGFVNGCSLNAELKNYRGTGHGFMMYGWHFDTPTLSPTQQRIVNVKIQGYWEKGIPVSLHWFGGLGQANCPQNTIVNVELDVICDTSMGVAFWCTGGIHESNRFNISGKIVTKSPGMPCITISNIAAPTNGDIQTNNTITLKDLLLINDGTVAPIMINPTNAQAQEVQIQNVKANSLILDANITEIGESIVRNANYK